MKKKYVPDRPAAPQLQEPSRPPATGRPVQPTADRGVAKPPPAKNNAQEMVMHLEVNAPPDKKNNAEPVEDGLDALLDKVEERKQKKFDRNEEQPDVIDQFRGRMRQIYLPIFEDLSKKYAEKGVEMELDADEFLGGGNNLKIRLTYEEISMELDGTVMRGGVAFYIIRGVGNAKGAVVSGPMLKIRNLSAADFRQFIVVQLSNLIKDALRQV